MPVYLINRPERTPGNQPRGHVEVNAGSPHARGLVFWAPGPGTHVYCHSLALGARRSIYGDPKGGIGGRRTGLCLSFDHDGTDDRIDYPYYGYDTALGFTITAWVLSAELVPTLPRYSWCSHLFGDAAVGGIVFQFGDGAASGQIGCTINRNTSAMQRVTQDGFVADGVWQHVAVSYNGGTAATGINIYNNAVVSASYSVSSNGSGAVLSQTGTHSIGGRIFDDARNWYGGIADTRVYNRVIPAEELQTMVRPESRWDLYWQPSNRVYFNVSLGGYTPDPASVSFAGLSAGLRYQINMPDEA